MTPTTNRVRPSLSSGSTEKGERILPQPRQRLGPPSSSCSGWQRLGQEGHFYCLFTPSSIGKTPCFSGRTGLTGFRPCVRIAALGGG